jgi:hypothetical protein
MVKDVEFVDYVTIIDPTDEAGRVVDETGWLACKQTAVLLGLFKESMGSGLVFHADLGDHRTSQNALNVLQTYGTTLKSHIIANYLGYTRIYDSYGNRPVDAPPVTHLCYIIPAVHKNYGPFYPLAGSRYAVLSQAQDVYYTPLTQAERDELTLSNVNYIIKSRDGIYFDLQRTSKATYGPLSYLNIAYLVIYFRRDLRRALRPFVHELDLPEVKNAAEKAVNTVITYWRDRGGLVSGSVSIDKPEGPRSTKYNVKVTIFPTREIEKIDVLLEVY